MSELVFEVHQEEDGGFWAKAVGAGIFTQGDTWEELRAMVLDATRGYFFDSQPPSSIRLHLMPSQLGEAMKLSDPASPFPLKVDDDVLLVA